MSITFTQPPIATRRAVLRHRITHLDRAAGRAERNRHWQDAAAYAEELDDCALELVMRSEWERSEVEARERAERGARTPEAVARSLDPYDVAVELVNVYERR